MSSTSDGLINTNVASQIVQPSWLVFYGACFTMTIKSVRMIHCRDVRIVLVSTKMETCLSTIHFESPSSTHLEALNKHPRWCHVWHAHSSAFFARVNRFKPLNYHSLNVVVMQSDFSTIHFLSFGWTFSEGRSVGKRLLFPLESMFTWTIPAFYFATNEHCFETSHDYSYQLREEKGDPPQSMDFP